MDIFNKIGEKITSGVSATTTKTKEFAEIQKLNSSLNQKKSALMQKFADIGKIYFEKYSTNVEDAEISNACMEVKLIQSEIEKLEINIIELKRERKCENCKKVIPMDSTFCAFCGSAQSALNKCVKCFSQLDENSMFCSSCGTKQPMRKVESPSVTTYAPEGDAVLGEVEREDAIVAMAEIDTVAEDTPVDVQEPVVEDIIPEQASQLEPVEKNIEPIKEEVSDEKANDNDSIVPEDEGIVPDFERTPLEKVSNFETSKDEDKLKCKQCGIEMTTDSTFCTECGTKVEEVKSESQPAASQKVYCSSCGNSEDTGTLFCSECGTRF